MNAGATCERVEGMILCADLRPLRVPENTFDDLTPVGTRGRIGK